MIIGSADIDVTRNKSLAEEAKELGYTAIQSANGKNTNYYGEFAPSNYNLKVDDTWFKQNNKGICVGIYRWNGSGWTQAKLDHEALTVGQLSAISADLGTVSAGNMFGVNLRLGTYNSTLRHYPFEALADGSVFMSKLTVDNDADSLTYGFRPKIEIGNGKWEGRSRIKRVFDNQGSLKNAYYDTITSIEEGHFRIRTLNKYGTTTGNDKDFSNYGGRSMYYSERGISTAYGIFAGTSGEGVSRYIDFWPGENGYNNDDSSQRGMKIYSGLGMLIEGGSSSRPFDIISNGELNISGSKTTSLSGSTINLNSYSGSITMDSNSAVNLTSRNSTNLTSYSTLNLTASGNLKFESNSDLTSSSSRAFFRSDTGETMLRMTYDNTSNFIASDYIPQRTYSSAANVYVTANGVLGKSTSASKYKLLIKDADSVIENAKNILKINPSKWFDKAECEAISESITKDELDKLSLDNKIRHHYGFVAEHFRDNGLDEVVVYDDNTGEIDGLQYDRIAMYQNEVIKDHEKTINELKEKTDKQDKMINDLLSRLEKLESFE